MLNKKKKHIWKTFGRHVHRLNVLCELIKGNVDIFQISKAKLGDSNLLCLVINLKAINLLPGYEFTIKNRNRFGGEIAFYIDN